jgi:hypothetical protein
MAELRSMMPHEGRRNAIFYCLFNSPIHALLLCLGFGRFLASLREQGILSSIIIAVLELQDYVRGYSQMTVELFRNLRCHLLSNGDDWFFTDPSMPASPSNASPKNKSRGRRRNVASVVAPVASRIGSSRMPELEEMDDNKRNNQTLNKVETLDLNKENTDPLEPAFLRDEDYPPGWLVFDPVLGVVSKTEADDYKLQQKQKKERQQQQQQQQHQDQKPPERPQNLQQQQLSMEQKSNATPRPLRHQHVMPKASSMHTPHTIAANG